MGAQVATGLDFWVLTPATASAITKLIALFIGVLIGFFAQTIMLSALANGEWNKIGPRQRAAMARVGGVAALIAGLTTLTADPTSDGFQLILHMLLAQVIAGAAGARAVQSITGRVYPVERGDEKEGNS